MPTSAITSGNLIRPFSTLWYSVNWSNESNFAETFVPVICRAFASVPNLDVQLAVPTLRRDADA